MSKLTRSVLIGVLGLVAFAAYANTATAATIATVSLTLVQATGNTLTLRTISSSITCNLTLSATFASSITLNSPLTRVGQVVAGSTANCIGANVTLLGLPPALGGATTAPSWDIVAVLPLPTDGRQANLRFLNARIGLFILPNGPFCLYQDNGTGGALIGSLSGDGNSITFNAAGIPRIAPPSALTCPTTSSLIGSLSLNGGRNPVRIGLSIR